MHTFVSTLSAFALSTTPPLESKQQSIIGLLQRTSSLSRIFQTATPPSSTNSIPTKFTDDLFGPLCEILSNDGDTKTLLAIQRVSQAGWEAATPHIYRQVRIRDTLDWSSLLNPLNTTDYMTAGLHILHKGKKASPGVLDRQPSPASSRLERLRLAWKHVCTLIICGHPTLGHRALITIAPVLLGTSTCFSNCIWISMPAVTSIHKRAVLLEDRNTVYTKILGPGAYRRICLSRLARPYSLCIQAIDCIRIGYLDSFTPSSIKCPGKKVGREHTAGVLKTAFASELKLWSFHASIDLANTEFLPCKLGALNRTVLDGVMEVGEQLEDTILKVTGSIYNTLRRMAESEERGEVVSKTGWQVLCEEEMVETIGNRIVELLLLQEQTDIEENGESPVTKAMRTKDGFTCVEGFSVRPTRKDLLCFRY